ncbi:MAG: hybrid sensor histidine kinase/response regulator [Nannocystales bacterium]
MHDDKDSKTSTLGRMGAEARVRGVLAALPDLMFVISRDLVFEEYQTPDPEKLLMPPSSFVGKRVDEVLPPDVASRVNDAVRGTLADGERRTVPYALDFPDGRQWFEAISGLCDEDSVLFVVRDRTRQVLLEERLRMRDRMASLGTLASGVAHEINNPLTYVLGNLDFIRDSIEPGGDEDLLGAFSDVVHGLEQVSGLIADLRVFSHPGSTEPTAVDLNHVVEATLRLAKGALNRHAVWTYEAQELPAVAGNASQVGQVVLNLVTNAIDAIGSGAATDNEIRIETHHDDERVTLTVSDTGAGIPPEIRERIFDPFVTSQTVGTGTGLALAVCRSLVVSLGGTIRAECRSPRGTVVTVAFPRHEAKPTAVPERKTEPCTFAPQEARILVVDDDDRVAQVTARALEGYEVVVALDGRAALEEIRRGQAFDLVLCDLMMPGMTGMELYRAVEDSDPDLAGRFVFMTGAAYSPDARSFVESTARPLLQKPFALASLRMTIAERLRVSQA